MKSSAPKPNLSSVFSFTYWMLHSLNHLAILFTCSIKSKIHNLPSKPTSTHNCISDRYSTLFLTHPGSERQSFLKLPSDNPQVLKVLSLQWFFLFTALDRTLVQALAPNSYKSVMASYLLPMWFGPTETTTGLLKTHPRSYLHQPLQTLPTTE